MHLNCRKNYLTFRVLLEVGYRSGELIQLKVSDVDLAGHFNHGVSASSLEMFHPAFSI